MQAKQTGNRMLHSTAMSEDRIRQLEELGFVWALRSGQDNTWRKHISDLADFRANHGHTAVPGNYKGNPILGEWAVAMREAYKLRSEGKGNLLDEEKIAELDTLGFSWMEPPQEVADATNNEGTLLSMVLSSCMRGYFSNTSSNSSHNHCSPSRHSGRDARSC
jgi:hypothetical protein